MKVLIIGCNGFIGTWLSEFMQVKGVRVFGIDKSEDSILYDSIKPIDKKNFYKFDIREREHLEQIIEKIGADVIIHLASQPLVSVGYKNPYHTFSNNIIGTLNILEAFKKNESSKMLICITSDKCYEEKGNTQLKETDSLGFSDPYSTSKAIQELLCGSYGKLNYLSKKKIITLRLGNVIGGGDLSKDRLIPDVMKYIYQRVQLNLRNSCAIRSWQYVLDLVNCIWKIIIKNQVVSDGFSYESFNLAGFKDCKLLSVKEMVNIILKKGEASFHEIGTSYYENQTLLLDTNKIVNYIGEYRNCSLQQSINDTKEIYKLIFKEEDRNKVKQKIDKVIEEY